MGLKLLLVFTSVFILIGYYLYVLYRSLKYKRKYNKSADAADLYGKTRLFHEWFFRYGGKEDHEKYKYKILKDDTRQNEKSL